MSRRQAATALFSSLSASTSWRCASSYASTSSSSSASGGLPPIQPLPALPKPPLATWYTGRPSLNAFISELQSALQETRYALYRAGYLESASQDIRSLPSSLSNFTAARWLSQEDAAQQLAVGKVRLAFYRKITGLLAELHALQPMLARETRLQGQNSKVLDLLQRFRKQDMGSRNNGKGLDLTPIQSTELDALVGNEEGSLRKKATYGAYNPTTRIAYGGGKKKTAIAQAWILPVKQEGDRPLIGSIRVNFGSLPDRFTEDATRSVVMRPFSLTETAGKFNVFILVNGGGQIAQAQAASVACARALAARDDNGVSRAILSKGEYIIRSCGRIN